MENWSGFQIAECFPHYFGLWPFSAFKCNIYHICLLKIWHTHPQIKDSIGGFSLCLWFFQLSSWVVQVVVKDLPRIPYSLLRSLWKHGPGSEVVLFWFGGLGIPWSDHFLNLCYYYVSTNAIYDGFYWLVLLDISHYWLEELSRPLEYKTLITVAWT